MYTILTLVPDEGKVKTMRNGAKRLHNHHSRGSRSVFGALMPEHIVRRSRVESLPDKLAREHCTGLQARISVQTAALICLQCLFENR